MLLPIWILCGCIFTSTILYIIGLIKKIDLMNKISSLFILPFTEAITIIFLYHLLPDSFHILLISIISLSLSCVAVILFIFDKKRVLKIISHICFLIAQLFWIELFKSTFYMHRVPSWLCIATIIFYLVILSGAFIFSGKLNIFVYINYTAEMIICAAVNLLTFINLCFEANLCSTLQFLGSFITCGMVVFYILNHSKYNFKYKNSILLILIIISQSLISAGNILMIK